jgi:hypothetical protein
MMILPKRDTTKEKIGLTIEKKVSGKANLKLLFQFNARVKLLKSSTL